MKALELSGQIDESGNLKLSKPLDIRNKEVRIIILIPDETDITDEEWIQAASTNSVFNMVKDEEEIYSVRDGEPFLDEI